ncbi:MAG: putative nucleic acid-binding protein [Verrucomicrobiales bacterium]|jgi:predicted nucleic acid-binding protein
MNGYLLDTNVLSELRKGGRADERVRKCVAGLPSDQLYLSVIVLAEIRKGIAGIRSRDPQQAIHLETWRARLESEYDFLGRLLTVDAEVARAWGDLQGVRPVSIMDGFLAATALVRDLTIVTRNESDFSGLGVGILNPFAS